MRIYRNEKTGVEFSTPCEIVGGDWVEVAAEEKLDPVDLTPDDIIESDDDIQLSKMTVKEIKELAIELGIDLGGASKKSDIIDIILAAQDAEEPSDE